jgi:hypothetical protein
MGQPAPFGPTEHVARARRCTNAEIQKDEAADAARRESARARSEGRARPAVDDAAIQPPLCFVYLILGSPNRMR